jgi:DNA-binding NarL/FixJ family response regulator
VAGVDEPTRVLVVDDHHMVAFGLGVALDGEPDVDVLRRVQTVADAMVAVEEQRPHVVLMDFHLPDGNGIDATRAIKARHPEIKVMLVTGSADEWVFAGAIDVCDGFVDKAQPFEDLVAAVRAARRGEAVVPLDRLSEVLPLLRRRGGGRGEELTRREHEVLTLMSEGLSNPAIAERLMLSIHTVRNHVQSVLLKLNAHTRLEAVSHATRQRLIRRQ